MNIKQIEGVQRRMVALQNAMNALASLVHELYMGELKSQVRALEDDLAAHWKESETEKDFAE
ncbi:MAG: hypothetical protein HOO20_15675 [Rhodospirillaceae bacterium]|nr:hypothetical protein [Rhodospirillaceae bacterium]